VHETADDLAALQALLDSSFERAGEHFRRITTDERRLSAEQVCERLRGMSLLVLATVTKDGRPLNGPVDGIFHRGHFYFGSAPDSVRFRHIAQRPWVSATHIPAEEFAVTVHGRAVPIDVQDPAEAAFRKTLLEVYIPRYGADWEQFLDSGVQYARIHAERMFTYSMPPEQA
jgi:nitroimidazol reductase NimA-like FMN-containing flavoprotein (pyridoxamine 5'-phosphate oxidase superfamily)